MYGWEPGIGDPTVYGWATVAAYALGAACSWLAAQRAPPGEKRFWQVIALVMAFLCVNKQLDLQTLLTDFARAQAKAQGWYDNRREYQVEFIVALGFAALVGLSILLTHSVRGSVPMRGASGGLILLVFFVLVRASSFNKVDLLISRRIVGLRANHLMELGGIALVTIFALAGAGVLGARRSS